MSGQDNESIGLLQGITPVEKEKREPPQEVRQPAEARGSLVILPVDAAETEIAAGTVIPLSAVIKSSHPSKGEVRVKIEMISSSNYPGEGVEWRGWVRRSATSKEEIFSKPTEKGIPVDPNGSVPITIEVEAPVGVRYKDRVDLTISARWKGDDSPPVALKLSWVTRQALLAIKTFRGYEREVADSLGAKAEEMPGTIFSLLVPSAMRGYVFAEGMSFDGVNDMLKGIRKARGLVKGETSLKEVEPLLEPKVTVEGFVEGAIVELISGPFKGEKARVKRIDQEKEHITVELIEAVVPIPVTVRGDHVRMVEKGGN